jgi:hypothetical protein
MCLPEVACPETSRAFTSAHFLVVKDFEARFEIFGPEVVYFMDHDAQNSKLPQFKVENSLDVALCACIYLPS